MKVKQVVWEHLGDDWWTKEHDTSTIGVLLDRIRDQLNCTLSHAIWYIIWLSYNELYAAELWYPKEAVSIRHCILEGNLAKAFIKIKTLDTYKQNEYWKKIIECIYTTIVIQDLDPSNLEA